jgi:hypothetical protein
MNSENSYYVYVYIDPRNFEEFYYGKGKGDRKSAHLQDTNDTEKTRRIKAITDAGLQPIIRVIAAGLTETDAFLVEKTLIWKLGRNLTNASSGRFSESFRPYDSFHKLLPGFDFQNGIYYVNVGEGSHRAWEDCRKYGFLSAGQGTKWRDQILTLSEGDVAVAYLKGRGYVGIGRIEAAAVAVAKFYCGGKSLKECKLACPNIFENSDDLEKSEYLVRVDWIKTVSKEDARFKKKHGLFTTQLVRASLSNQTKTMAFLESEFGVHFADLMK